MSLMLIMFLYYKQASIPTSDGAKVKRKSLIPKDYEINYKYLDGIKIEKGGFSMSRLAD